MCALFKCDRAWASPSTRVSPASTAQVTLIFIYNVQTWPKRSRLINVSSETQRLSRTDDFPKTKDAFDGKSRMAIVCCIHIHSATDGEMSDVELCRMERKKSRIKITPHTQFCYMLRIVEKRTVKIFIIRKEIRNNRRMNETAKKKKTEMHRAQNRSEHLCHQTDNSYENK